MFFQPHVNARIVQVLQPVCSILFPPPARKLPMVASAEYEPPRYGLKMAASFLIDIKRHTSREEDMSSAA